MPSTREAERLVASVSEEVGRWFDGNLDRVLEKTRRGVERDLDKVEQTLEHAEREDYGARCELVDGVRLLEEALGSLDSGPIEEAREELREVLHGFVGLLQEDLRDRDERYRDLHDTFRSLSRKALSRLDG